MQKRVINVKTCSILAVVLLFVNPVTADDCDEYGYMKLTQRM